MAAAAAPMAEMDLGATIDSAVDESVAESTPEPTSAPAPEPTSSPDPSPSPDPSADPATAAPDAPPAQAQQESPEIQGMREYAEAVQAKFPTVADAEAAYGEASDYRAMMNDFQFGTESDMDAFLNHLAGGSTQDPQTRVAMQQGFERMAARIPQMLQKVSPQAYGKFLDTAVQGQLAALYERAQQTGNPQDLIKAQWLEYGLTQGQYKTELPKVDPVKAEQDRIAQQQQQMSQRESQMLQRDWSYFNKQAVDGPKWQQFDAEIDKTLAPIKESYKPEIFSAIRGDIRAKILDKLKEDFEFTRNHNNARVAIERGYEQAWRGNQNADHLNPRAQAYIADFMTRARRILPSIAKPLIDKATASPAAAAAPKPANPQSAAQPIPRAQNGQFAPRDRRIDLRQDPEFSSMFA